MEEGNRIESRVHLHRNNKQSNTPNNKPHPKKKLANTDQSKQPKEQTIAHQTHPWKHIKKRLLELRHVCKVEIEKPKSRVESSRERSLVTLLIISF